MSIFALIISVTKLVRGRRDGRSDRLLRYVAFAHLSATDAGLAAENPALPRLDDLAYRHDPAHHWLRALTLRCSSKTMPTDRTRELRGAVLDRSDDRQKSFIQDLRKTDYRTA
jgi:hypothetical protein